MLWGTHYLTRRIVFTCPRLLCTISRPVFCIGKSLNYCFIHPQKHVYFPTGRRSAEKSFNKERAKNLTAQIPLTGNGITRAFPLESSLLGCYVYPKGSKRRDEYKYLQCAAAKSSQFQRKLRPKLRELTALPCP